MHRQLCFPILFFLSISANALYAQQVDSTAVEPEQPPKVRRDTRPLKERISLGGSTSFWFNSKKTFIEVSPLLAYHFPKILTTGVGYRYIYSRDRFYGKDLNTYGPNIFARASITKRIYAWAEYEYLNTEYVVELANQEVTTATDQVDSFFVGIGYIRSIGKKGKGGLSFQLLYNFFYNREDNSPYLSPVTYRVGYFF